MARTRAGGERQGERGAGSWDGWDRRRRPGTKSGGAATRRGRSNQDIDSRTPNRKDPSSDDAGTGLIPFGGRGWRGRVHTGGGGGGGVAVGSRLARPAGRSTAASRLRLRWGRGDGGGRGHEGVELHSARERIRVSGDTIYSSGCIAWGEAETGVCGNGKRVGTILKSRQLEEGVDLILVFPLIEIWLVGILRILRKFVALNRVHRIKRSPFDWTGKGRGGRLRAIVLCFRDASVSR